MITDNTAKWQKKKLTNFASNEALPVGHIYQSLSKNVPSGSLPLFGGTYDRTLYADLWSWANENGLVVSEAEWQAQASAQGGSCSKFSEGNGSTTFRVPALKCWVKGANGVEEVGSYLQDGLPNIWGHFYASSAVVASDGAFTVGNNNYWSEGSHGSLNNYVGFDASRSNPIYGKSDTVQPPSIVAMYCIVAYGTVTNVGNADVANIMQVVEQVQRDCGNYMPLSGGTMTGNITAQGDAIPTIGRVENNKQVTLYGGSSYETGAVIGLKGIDNHDIAGEEGGFFISSTDGTTKHWLSGFKNGELLWNGSRVINGVSIQAQQVTTSNTPMYLPAGGTWVGIWAESVSDNDYATNGIIYAAGGSLFHTTAYNTEKCSAIYFRVI